MLNMDLFRKYEEEKIINYCQKRKIDQVLVKEIINLDKQARILQTKIQDNKAKINNYSKEFSIYLAKHEDEKLNELKQKVQSLKVENNQFQLKYDEINDELLQKLYFLPNFPQDDVPDGLDEKDNVLQKKFSTPRDFNFNYKAHWDLMVEKKLVDLDAAQRISGTRYIIYKGLGARLIRALQLYTLECNLMHGYEEYLPPVIVDEKALFNTGQLPKFQEDLFKLQNEKKYLSPTAEVQLTNLFAGELIKEENLPLNFTANTACFRSEAGSAGRDTRGVIRQHQFYKTEIVKICKPEDSAIEHEKMTRDAEYILESLNLPYQRILLCSGDMGFSAQKTYDLEVWLPSYNAYKEISSCSNCGDFQARRMKTRARTIDGVIYYPHTLNGSALAIDRLFAAVIENYQEADGSITIPEPLRKYMNNMEKII